MYRHLWELGYRQDLSQAHSTAARGAARADTAVEQVKELARRVDKLTLINMALWSFIQQHTRLTEEDLLRRVEEIDLSDGQLDGRVSRPSVACPACERTMSPRHDRCIYCGAERATKSAFDAAW